MGCSRPRRAASGDRGSQCGQSEPGIAGYALGLVNRSNTTDRPFPDDRSRWSRHHIDKDFINKAVEEGRRGFLDYPLGNRAVVHVLHTDERRAQLETITGMRRGEQARELMDEYIAVYQE